MAYLPYSSQQTQDQDGMNNPQVPGNQQPQIAAPVQSGSALSAPVPNQQQARQQQKGSGTFTDLRKYVQSNQPKAAQIGQALSQTTGQQAAQIGQQVQKQQNDLGARIAENQSRIQGQQDFGQGLVGQAASGQTLTNDDINRFRNITTGAEKFSTVQGLNTAQAQQGVSELQRVNQGVQQQPVRSELLRSTFGKQDQYGAGQKALDDMLVASNRPVMQDLMSKIKQQTQQAQAGIQGAQQQAVEQQNQLAQRQTDVQKALQSQAEAARTGVKTAADARSVQAEQEVNDLFTRLKSGKITQADADLLGIKKGTSMFVDSSEGWGNNTASRLLNSLSNNMSMNKLLGPQAAMVSNLGGMDYSAIRDAIKTGSSDVLTKEEAEAANMLSQLSGQEQLYSNANAGGYVSSRENTLADLSKQIQNGNQANKDNALRQIASRHIYNQMFGDPNNVSDWGNDYHQYVRYYTDPEGVERMGLSGAGINRFGAAGEGQIDRYFQNLAGQVDRAMGMRDVEIAKDGGIMGKFSSLRNKVKKNGC